MPTQHQWYRVIGSSSTRDRLLVASGKHPDTPSENVRPPTCWSFQSVWCEGIPLHLGR